MEHQHYDVAIIGAGFAGLTLARQLLLRSDVKILHLEKNQTMPSTRQKVGESNVQVQGYYLGKVLDLEEYLFHEHLMKYNLRFLWSTPGLANDQFDHLSQSYIRTFSNIPCYQLDRNKIEGYLIESNGTFPTYRLLKGVGSLLVDLKEKETPHELTFKHEGTTCSVTANWVVDSCGRVRKLARQMGLREKAQMHHSSSFFWVDGTVNIEKLGNDSPRDRRMRRSRSSLGHLPMWLATNHFMGEGYWFWVIPLRGRTSFGLVYDSALVDSKRVSSREGLFEWLFEQYPLFQAELENRQIIDFTVMHNYTHDCGRTIHRDGWAMSGESGRFTDPLYSPGGDLIAMHNTLITDAILETEPGKLSAKVNLYETLFQALYKAFLPSYEPGYATLGNQEAFAMKYTWELSIYFAFYVFPFINDLLTDRLFLVGFFRRFASLGEVNRKVLNHIMAFVTWRKEQEKAPHQPIFYDFTEIETLKKAESTFYKIGLEPKQALAELEVQLGHLMELARFIIAHIDSVMLDAPQLLTDEAYLDGLDLKRTEFSQEWARSQVAEAGRGKRITWSFDAGVLQRHFSSTLVATGV